MRAATTSKINKLWLKLSRYDTLRGHRVLTCAFSNVKRFCCILHRLETWPHFNSVWRIMLPFVARQFFTPLCPLAKLGTAMSVLMYLLFCFASYKAHHKFACVYYTLVMFSALPRKVQILSFLRNRDVSDKTQGMKIGSVHFTWFWYVTDSLRFNVCSKRITPRV